MLRKAFLMQVKLGKIDEYKKEHNPIWPELQEVFKKHGINSYSIFYHNDTEQLFGYVEFEDEEQFRLIAETDVCRRWWLHMKNFLVSNSDESIKAKEEELEEIFHIQ